MSQMKSLMQYVFINACARVHDEIYSPSHDFSLIAQGRSPSAINEKISYEKNKSYNPEHAC